MLTVVQVRASKIIAIIRGVSEAHTLKVVEALHRGGLDLIEITFDQSNPESWPVTADAIRGVNNSLGGEVTIGAGTVMSQEQLQLAYSAGAQFIVTPNTNPALIKEVKKLGLLSLPGAMTPSEIFDAYSAGADAVKVFPAGILGSAYIKAISAPLSNIPLLAVGGIHAGNTKEFLQAGCCGVGVGGNLVNREWILSNQWNRIEEEAYRLTCSVKDLQQ